MKKARFSIYGMLLLVMSLIIVTGAGCGAMNEYTGAALNYTEQGYAGAQQNVKNIEGAKVKVWADSAKLLTLEGLSQAPPSVIEAALKVAPIPGVAIIHSSDGSIIIQQATAQPVTITAPYSGAK
jgi:hypothetical protein